MSAGSLFHTVAAATAKALVPMTVFVRCTTSFMVSADCKCRRLRTVEAKTLWGQTMDAFEVRHGHLKVNSMSNRKPMKVAQYRCYVVVLITINGENVLQ